MPDRLAQIQEMADRDWTYSFGGRPEGLQNVLRYTLRRLKAAEAVIVYHGLERKTYPIVPPPLSWEALAKVVDAWQRIVEEP